MIICLGRIQLKMEFICLPIVSPLSQQLQLLSKGNAMKGLMPSFQLCLLHCRYEVDALLLLKQELNNLNLPFLWGFSVQNYEVSLQSIFLITVMFPVSSLIYTRCVAFVTMLTRQEQFIAYILCHICRCVI